MNSMTTIRISLHWSKIKTSDGSTGMHLKRFRNDNGKNSIAVFARRLVPWEVSSDLRYLNSGCVAGYASALKLATGRILQHDGLNQYVTYSRPDSGVQDISGLEEATTS